MNRLIWALLLLALPLGQARAAEPSSEIKLDYAYYSPASLVIKKLGWMEEEFKGTPVKWVLSLGSNRALEYLNAGAIDVGSTAALSSVLARANGNPIKAVYIFSQPEWTALVVGKDSKIQSLADLKGKRIAATKGTDAHLFLLRALRTAGLSKDDIELVHLQHPDGRAALEAGKVDAWAGLDPHMAASELTAGSRLIYRNVAFNSLGFLNAREEFAATHPGELRRILQVYARARKWLIEHPDEAARILAAEARLPLEVARRQLERTQFIAPVPTREQVEKLQASAPLLQQEGLVKPGTDLNQVIGALIDTDFARPVIAKSK
jgi:sulfonate transport system substrate-binding protein